MKYYFTTCSIFVLLYGIEVTGLSILPKRTQAAPLSLLGSPTTTTTKKPLQKDSLTSALSRLLGLTSRNPKVDDANVIKNSDQLSLLVKKETVTPTPRPTIKITSVIPDLVSMQDKFNVKPTLPTSLTKNVPNTISSIGIVGGTSPPKSDVTTTFTTTSPKDRSNPVLLDLQLSDSKSIIPPVPDVEDKVAAKLNLVNNNNEQQGDKMITEHAVFRDIGQKELQVGKDEEREPQINRTVVDAKPEASSIVRILSNLDLNIINPIKTAFPSNKDVSFVLQSEPQVNKSDDVSQKQEEVSTNQSLVPKSNDEQHAEGLREKVEEDVIRRNVEKQIVRMQEVQDYSEVKTVGQQQLNETQPDLKSEVSSITGILSKENLKIDKPSVDQTIFKMSDANTDSVIQPVLGMLAMSPFEPQLIQTDVDSPKQEEQSTSRSVFEKGSVAGSTTEPFVPLLESTDQFTPERNTLDIAVLSNVPKLENIRSFGPLHESTEPFAAALNNLFTSELSENTAKSTVTNIESTAARNSIAESSLLATKILFKPEPVLTPSIQQDKQKNDEGNSTQSTSEGLFTAPNPAGLTNIDANPPVTNVESAEELVKTPSWTTDLESGLLPVPLAELKNSPKQLKADSTNLVLSEPDTEYTEELKNADTAVSNNLLDLLSNEPASESTASLLPDLRLQVESIAHVETTDDSRRSAEDRYLHSLKEIERIVPAEVASLAVSEDQIIPSVQPTVASLPDLSSKNSPLSVVSDIVNALPFVPRLGDLMIYILSIISPLLASISVSVGISVDDVVSNVPALRPLLDRLLNLPGVSLGVRNNLITSLGESLKNLSRFELSGLTELLNLVFRFLIDLSRTIPSLLSGISLENILTGLPNLTGTFERILPNLRVGGLGPSQNYATDTSIGQYENFNSYGVAPLIDIHDNQINLVKIVIG